ncbi:44472_t:CDS:2, partial [Gigaspora margarita]
MSEIGKYPYNDQRKEKGNFNPTKNISFCELEDTNNEEIYTLPNDQQTLNGKIDYEKLVEVPISNSGIESLIPYEDVDVYSESGDTFDEFDYKEEELEDLEEENINKNPVQYLTNIEEVPTKKEDKEEKEKTVEERIKEI